MDFIYINNVKRQLVTPLGTRFFVDADCLPGRRCAQHTLQPVSVDWLKRGGKVRTSGNWYSLSPDPEPPT